MQAASKLKLTTADAGAIYAEKIRGRREWKAALPGGGLVMIFGSVAEVVAEMRRLAGHFGGAGRLYKWDTFDWVPYEPAGGKAVRA